MAYLIIILIIIIGFLGYKLSQKQLLDQQVLTDYQDKKSNLETIINLNEIKIESNK